MQFNISELGFWSIHLDLKKKKNNNNNNYKKDG
jgi:hypothetical protein